MLRMRGTTRGVLVGVLVVLLGLLAAGYSPPARAAALPGGKANWVAAVGGLTSGTAYRNWVRLGYYQFAPDGTVVHNWWHWSQRDQPPRVRTGVDFECSTSTDVPPECDVLTGEGFTGPPEGGFTGTFSVSGSALTVSWTHDRDGSPLSRPLVEYWDVAAVDAELTRATGNSADFSDYSATHGFAYGSDATFDRTTRAAMAEIRDAGTQGDTTTYNAWAWNRGQVANPHSGFGPYSTWQLCDSGRCLGHVQHDSNCDCGPSASSRDRHYYFAEHDDGRRNTMWLWCECLADARGETCYTGNSHIRPLLQVIDDGGDFRGWVGVEPFANASSPGDFHNEYWIAFELTDAA